MHSPRTTFYTQAALLVLVFMISGLAAAESGPYAEESRSKDLDRWVPAFGMYTGGMGQPGQAEISSCCDTIYFGTAVIPTTDPLRPPSSDSELLVAPFFGGTVELMSPTVGPSSWSPRFFIRGDVTGVFAQEKDLAREASPGEMVNPMLPAFNAGGITGQGQVVSAKWDSMALSAGMGLAFTFELWDRTFRIRPSAEWMRTELALTGVVHTVQRTRPGRIANADTGETRVDSTFRFVELEASTSQAFHMVGPGLELEMDAGRAGPFVLTLFASAQAYHFIGKRDVSWSSTPMVQRLEGPASTSGPDSTPPFPPALKLDPNNLANDEVADFYYKQNRWSYRGGVGLRFRWSPE